MKIYNEEIFAHAILYMRRTGPYGIENYRLMEQFKEWVKQNHLWNLNGTIYGIAQDDMTVTPPENCRYDVCYVTDDTSSEDKDIYYGTLPSGKYLVAKIIHTAEAVQNLYASIPKLLEQEQKEYDTSRPILERYRIAVVNAGYCEICIPTVH